MDNRDCKTCAYSSPGEGIGNGCTAWKCEYINKREAIEVWKAEKLYLCDGKKCEVCNPDCFLTRDRAHACKTKCVVIIDGKEERHGNNESGETDQIDPGKEEMVTAAARE